MAPMSDGTSASSDLGSPAGRRPVCVLTRDAAIAVLTSVTRAPITRSRLDTALRYSLDIAY
jgi:mRNA-degrading endonuclease toxin of MazEF toxin-antitoxin module